MSYVEYEYFKKLYGSEISESDFNVLSFSACRKIDYYTTGVDGIKKLRIAFPIEEEASESVKRCVCSLINLLNDIKKAERSANDAIGYVQKEDGMLQGKVVTSISAGNEKTSYSVGSANATLIGQAVSDMVVREKLLRDIIKEYLSGVTDSNGVNLMYMGTYPCVRG